MQVPAKSRLFRESPQRTAPRAIDRLRHRNRAPMRMATAALPRTAQLRGMEDVENDPSRAQMRGHRDVRGRDAHAEHAVMRATEREHRARETDGQLRGDHDERRAPGEAAALTEEHRLRRIRRIGPETREYLEGARERVRTAPKR